MKIHPHETTVVALFKNPAVAQKALQALDEFHLEAKDVSLITSEEAYDKEELVEMITGDKLHSESVRAGKIGGMTGAILAALTAITGMVTGGASLLAAGPIVAVIAGAGGMLGSFLAAGFSENENENYDKALRTGQIMILIHAENKAIAKHAEQVLKAQGAERIHHHH